MSTLFNAIAAELPRLRAEAESRMTLTLAAFEPTGETTVDADGYETPVYAPKGSVFGRIRGGSQSAGDSTTRYVNIGGVERPVLAGGLHLPIGSSVPVASTQRGVGWEYEVTAVGSVDNPALLGRRFLVVGVSMVAQATALRLDVVEVPAPPAADSTTITYAFEGDADLADWVASEGIVIRASWGRLLADVTLGDYIATQRTATGSTVTATLQVAADASVGTLAIGLDNQGVDTLDTSVAAGGITEPATVTLGPLPLAGQPGYTLFVFAYGAGRIAIDNVVITITGG